MQFRFTPMNEEDALAILSWRYEGPYAIYSMGGDVRVEELLDTRSPYYAVRDEREELIGYFSYGTSCLVWDCARPAIYDADGGVAIGLGLRPDLMGKGSGLSFVEAGLDFARNAFTPSYFQLFVFPWNERAIRVYERAGFQKVRIYVQPDSAGGREFVEMHREI